MKMNTAMARNWERIHELLANTPLTDALQHLVEESPSMVGDALVLKSLLHNDYIIPSDLDTTGIEAFVNKIHISDYIPSHNGRDYQLVQGIIFAKSVAASLAHMDKPTRVILSRDPESEEVTVRFFVRRPYEPWGSDDPEQYELEEVAQWDIDPAF